MGQKRKFARKFMEVLEQYPDHATYVDLFGGSGLLSHITKRLKPASNVIYNDFDHCRRRLENIPRTNALLANIRPLAAAVPRHKALPPQAKEAILERIRREQQEQGYVDYITLSSSLLFSSKYATSLEALRRETFYNAVRTAPYPDCPDYLEGITVTSCDYKELFRKYKDQPGVVFLIDPPYLSTDTSAYTMMSWKLSDYLDVLQTLIGTDYIYFTSDKSSIIELCDWIGQNQAVGNPFQGCTRIELHEHMNYAASYTDIMLYKRKERGKDKQEGKTE